MAISTPSQRAAVRNSLWSLAIVLVVMGVLLFGPAGLEWALGWWFAAAFVVAILVSLAVLWRLNPEIFVARAKIAAGTKSWDYFFLALVIGGFMAVLPVAGLDFRFGWGPVAPGWVVGLGYVLFVVGFAGQVWPQAVNRHFEPSVRIQTDRGQTVIDTGPYAVIRHPGYVSGTLLAFGMALCLGSFWALLPALVVKLALLGRTLLEEKTLKAELPGYADYMARVRYRWVPGVW